MADNDPKGAPQTLYTIGHSNQTLDEFVTLLRQHKIEALVDVRSAPYSRYVPHFNKRELEAELREAGFHYTYLGSELGGRPDDPDVYDEAGYALYYLIAKRPDFQTGIARLKQDIASSHVAIMCSEEDPTDCHRRRLIARVLVDDGYEIQHIRGDGRLDSEDDLRFGRDAPAGRPDDQAVQQPLFGFDDEGVPSETWKSTRSVLPARAPRNSSES